MSTNVLEIKDLIIWSGGNGEFRAQMESGDKRNIILGQALNKKNVEDIIEFLQSELKKQQP